MPARGKYAACRCVGHSVARPTASTRKVQSLITCSGWAHERCNSVTVWSLRRTSRPRNAQQRPRCCEPKHELFLREAPAQDNLIDLCSEVHPGGVSVASRLARTRVVIHLSDAHTRSTASFVLAAHTPLLPTPLQLLSSASTVATRVASGAVLRFFAFSGSVAQAGRASRAQRAHSYLSFASTL